MGEACRGLHLLSRAILQGNWAIEHAPEDERGQKQTGSFHLTLDIVVSVSYIRIQLRGWAPGGGQKVA